MDHSVNESSPQQTASVKNPGRRYGPSELDKWKLVNKCTGIQDVLAILPKLFPGSSKALEHQIKECWKGKVRYTVIPMAYGLRWRVMGLAYYDNRLELP